MLSSKHLYLSIDTLSSSILHWFNFSLTETTEGSPQNVMLGSGLTERLGDPV